MNAASAAALVIVGAVLGFIVAAFVIVIAAAGTLDSITAWQLYQGKREMRATLKLVREFIANQTEREQEARKICSCDTCTGERIAREVLRGKDA